jgi:MinD-like ATPase involved in chromosome partitioning or flagellar assembly
VDAALVAFDLHRLSQGALTELTRTSVPLVLLAPQPPDERWATLRAVVLPLDAHPDAVQEALRAVVRGERPRAGETQKAPHAAAPPEAVDSRTPPDVLSVLAVAGGHGSPGRTTVAINLAAALGAVASTVLVDCDVTSPGVAAYLDADPTRNVYMLAHSEPATPGEWARALAQEVQPLAARSPQAVVLCGVPKSEMRAAITGRFVEHLVGALQSHYRYVILDIGAEVLGSEGVAHRAALQLAQQVLLVAAGDLVGLWQARVALARLETQLQVDRQRVALIVNRHDRRYHHSRAEIEWALGIPTAAVLPWDHAGAQRAVAAQRPVVLNGPNRLGRGLLELADRVHGGKVVLPREPAGANRLRWPRWSVPWRSNGARHHDPTGRPEQGASHGSHVASVR